MSSFIPVHQSEVEREMIPYINAVDKSLYHVHVLHVCCDGSDKKCFFSLSPTVERLEQS